MKRKLFIGAFFIFVVILWWQANNLEKEFNENLYLHQTVALNQVDTIHIWKKGTDLIKVATEDYINVLEWFNQYPPNRVSEEKVPLSNAQVIIDTKRGGTIIINYLDNKIYVSRNDVSRNDVSNPGIGYVFLDDAPDLEGFFKGLIN